MLQRTTTAPAPVQSPSLLERYRAYRVAQGRELLNLLPREGLRSVLRHLQSREGGLAASGVAVVGADPREPEGGLQTLDDLAARCSELLPLPPFHVWLQDFHRARGEYATLPGPPMAPETADGEAVTVETRELVHQGDSWVASLALRPLEDRWVGHIRFHSSEDDRMHQTGEILREGSPTEVRERFRGFDDHTVTAFLRSTLP